MKEKLSKIVRDICHIFAFLAVLAFPFSLLTCAYPKMLDYVLFVLFFAISVFAFVIDWVAMKDNKSTGLCRLERGIFFFSVIFYIQLIHISLLSHENEEKLIFAKVAEIFLNSEYAIFSSFVNLLAFFSVFLYLLKQIVLSSSEKSARVSVDRINSKLFAVDKERENKKIDEKEASLKKRKIQDEIDFYSERAFTCKILFECAIAFVVFTLVHLFSGIVLDVFIGEFSFKNAFLGNVPIVIGVFFSFVIIYILFALCHIHLSRFDRATMLS